RTTVALQGHVIASGYEFDGRSAVLRRSSLHVIQYRSAGPRDFERDSARRMSCAIDDPKEHGFVQHLLRLIEFGWEQRKLHRARRRGWRQLDVTEHRRIDGGTHAARRDPIQVARKLSEREPTL